MPHHFLQHQNDFVFVVRQGYALNGKYWKLHFCKNKTSHPRFGISITKRHLKRAVARNQVKRILREFFRQHSLLMLPSIDFFFRSIAPVPENKTQLRLDYQILIDRATSFKK